MNARRVQAAMVCIALASHAADARADQPLTCSIFEEITKLGIRDVPYEHAPIGLCMSNAIAPDENGLVACRMFWQYERVDDSHGVPTPRCEDHEFLSPTDENLFGDDRSTEGPTCLVRQVTKDARERGETGWYYLSVAPQYDCPNANPAAVIPTQRPDFDWQINVAWQCKAAMSIDVYGEVAFQDDLTQCRQPKPAEGSDIGERCDPTLTITDYGPTLELGSNGCASNLCLTRELGKTFCEEEGGVSSCRSADTVCTCRCAGDGPGPYCTCPETFECKPLLTSYGAPAELAGSYCIPPRPDVSIPSVPPQPAQP